MSECDPVLRRVIGAPRGAIYACWTTPAHMVHWFMPRPHWVSDVVIDPRPGGRFASVMHVDGQRITSEGCVLAAVPGELFVFTDLMEANFRPVAAPGLGFTAQIALSDHLEGTEYVVTARHRTAADAARHQEMGFTTGWGIVASQLEAYAAGLG